MFLTESQVLDESTTSWIEPMGSEVDVIVAGPGADPTFHAGEQVRVADRLPVGHYRVPTYLRGKVGLVESVIEPLGIDNEEEAYGRNAGNLLHYYRVRFPMSRLWQGYVGAPNDRLLIEIFETWLERI